MKTNILVYLIFMVFVRSAFALPPQIEADRQLIEAKEAISEKKFNKALESFEKINDLGVEMPTEYTYFYGKVLFETKKYNEAKAQIESYLVKEGRHGTYYQQALALYGQIEQAPKVEGQKNKEKLIHALENGFKKSFSHRLNNPDGYENVRYGFSINRVVDPITSCEVKVKTERYGYGWPSSPKFDNSSSSDYASYSISDFTRGKVLERRTTTDTLFGDNVVTYQIDNLSRLQFGEKSDAENVQYWAKEVSKFLDCSN